MNDLVSIIVPIYNVEKYLTRCVTSIINQTYENIEVLLIDDGSTDSSKDMCDNFSKMDNRIRCYHIKNGGVSNARNYGIQKSNGKYITFIDADDYVLNIFIEKLMYYQKKDDFDIVISEAIDFTDNGYVSNRKVRKYNKIMNKNDAVFHFLKQDLFNPVCWGRLYKKNVIDDIKFDINMRIAEDGKYLINAIEKSKKIIFISEKMYYYYIRGDSAIHLNFNEKFYDELFFCDELIEKYENNIILYRLAIIKELNYLYGCMLKKNMNKKDHYYLKQRYNEIYKKLDVNRLKLKLRRIIVNNKLLLKIFYYRNSRKEDLFK